MSLSPASRFLTIAFGVSSAVVGAVLFVAPRWSATEFPWMVTDFMAMTMGGWCLGNAFAAWVASRQSDWATSYAVLVYLWAFAVLEVAVLLWFRDKLRFAGVLTWPYLTMLGLGLAAAVWGVIDARRLGRFPPATRGAPMSKGVRGAVITFVAFVGLLATFGLVATDFGASRRVFPEALSPFTLRAFAAFYLALAVGALSQVSNRTIDPTLCYIRAGMGLIVPITFAAFVYIGRFDFSAHKGQVAYIAAYVGVGIASAIVLARARGTGMEHSR